MRRREFISLLSGTAAWPLAARAQPVMPVIGFLSANSAAATPQNAAALREDLTDAGFIEGKNVAIEFRFADQHLERLPKLAIDLVRRQVAVIVTGGGDVPAMIAKGATSTIPIVFVTGFDPVKSGLVTSLNRPSGNVTGATVIRQAGVEAVLQVFEGQSHAQYYRDVNAPENKEAFEEIASFFDKHLGK